MRGRRQHSPTQSTTSSSKGSVLVAKFQNLFDSFIKNNPSYAAYESQFEVIWSKYCKEYAIIPNSKVSNKHASFLAMIEKGFSNEGELIKQFIHRHINNIPTTNMNLQNIMMNQQTHTVPLQNISSILSPPISAQIPTNSTSNSTSTPTTNTQDTKLENIPNFTSEAAGLKYLQSLIAKCTMSLNIESLLVFTLECERIKSESEKTLQIYTSLVSESKKLQPFLENKISEELDKKENPDTILKSIYATLGNSHTKSAREKRSEKRVFEEIDDNILYDDPFQQSKGEYENDMENFLQEPPNYTHKVDISPLSKTNSTQSLSKRNNERRDVQPTQLIQQPTHPPDNVSTSSKTHSHHSNPSSKPLTSTNSQKTTPNKTVSDISEMSQSSSIFTPMQNPLQRIQTPTSIQTQQFPETHNSQFNYQNPMRTVQLNTQPGNFIQIQNPSFPLPQFPIASYYPATSYNQSNQYTYNSNNNK